MTVWIAVGVWVALVVSLAIALRVRRRRLLDQCVVCGADAWTFIGVTVGGGVVEQCGCGWVRVLAPNGEARMLSPEKWSKIAKRMPA